jgi:hypothetical protein
MSPVFCLWKLGEFYSTPPTQVFEELVFVGTPLLFVMELVDV